MGRDTFSRDSYVRASALYAAGAARGESVTAKAEQKARSTGKLNPLVDPAGYDVIRRSLPRFEQQPNGLWMLTVGTPVPVETRVDTTGSMGDNVDIAFRVLPKSHELISGVLPGCDLQIATGIFGDIQDRFVLCRPQFEMVAEKIVEQLTLMVPEKDGGDIPEDPHYGLFGAAYLTAAYITKIGLKSYDFTVSDAPARDLLASSQLQRIFGKEVFDKVSENGHEISRRPLPDTSDVVKDLLKIAHAFFLQVGDAEDTTRFWTGIFGRERVIVLPSTDLLPQVQATIIGLTEGTLKLSDAEDFLRKHNVSKENSKRIVRSVANIPIGAQAALPNYSRRPKAGDLFREKTDLWPIGRNKVASSSSAGAESSGGPNWL